ncbi:hypothetical protein BCV72DRAFT_33217 [Rhizopus microsporus var. microsporus]|uniref:Uncharacterized protein n=1 Tax=Rhizopus microsporus var. microsporus TaxID=86635 RepID=A0A1X0QUB0_RHIZD|nr:hypothetical protein BCV72DRAFT_33217 [Rhizopus microsporus var. microsporus]
MLVLLYSYRTPVFFCFCFCFFLFFFSDIMDNTPIYTSFGFCKEKTLRKCLTIQVQDHSAKKCPGDGQSSINQYRLHKRKERTN